MNLLAIASSFERLGKMVKWDDPKAVLAELDDALERLEIWYVVRFGRKLPAALGQPSLPSVELRIELLNVAHALSNLEIAINMGLAEQGRCANIALEAIHTLRGVRVGVQQLVPPGTQERGQQAGA